MQFFLSQHDRPLLTADEVAAHYRLRPSTIRRWSRDARIDFHRIGRQSRYSWDQVWSCEDSPFPQKQQRERYTHPLLTKQDLAALVSVSTRTVERWIAEGLPTRNVYNSVRLNPLDAEDWLTSRFGAELRLGKVEIGASDDQ